MVTTKTLALEGAPREFAEGNCHPRVTGVVSRGEAVTETLRRRSVSDPPA